jgi:hypothetical protein
MTIQERIQKKYKRIHKMKWEVFKTYYNNFDRKFKEFGRCENAQPIFTGSDKIEIIGMHRHTKRTRAKMPFSEWWKQTTYKGNYLGSFKNDNGERVNVFEKKRRVTRNISLVSRRNTLSIILSDLLDNPLLDLYKELLNGIEQLFNDGFFMTRSERLRNTARYHLRDKFKIRQYEFNLVFNNSVLGYHLFNELDRQDNSPKYETTKYIKGYTDYTEKVRPKDKPNEIIMYNMTAKKERRSIHKTGDKYKLEIVLNQRYFDRSDIQVNDFKKV